MRPYIKLTCNYAGGSSPVIVFIDAIETVSAQSTKGSIVSVVSHNNGGWKVAETVDEVMALIAAAERRAC